MKNQNFYFRSSRFLPLIAYQSPRYKKPLVALAAFLFSCAVFASSLSIPAKVVHVSEIKAVTSTGVTVTSVIKGFAANDPYAARVSTIPKAKFIGWVKPNIGTLVKANLWWVGFGAVMAAAGWAIDELTGQVQQQPLPSDYEYGYYYNVGIGSFSGYGATASDGCSALAKVSGYDVRWVDGRCLNYRSDGSIMQAASIGRGKCNLTIPQVAALYTCSGAPLPSTPVNDADLYNSLASYMTLNPSGSAFMDPYTASPYPDLFPDVPYIPNAAASDEALIDCYGKGSLVVASSGACSVPTQAEYDRIKDAYNAIKDKNSADNVAGDLNANMKQPITQAQYEETNKKYSDAVDAVTNSLPSNDSDIESIDDSFFKLDGIITDMPNAKLPDVAGIQLPSYSDCMTLNLTDGKGRNLVFPSASQCEKLSEIKRMFGYFLALGVAFALAWQLLNRPHG